MLVHVLVERVEDGNAVRTAELALPEAFEVVAPGVVGAGKLEVVGRRLARRTTLIPHRLEHLAAVLDDQHGGIPAWEDACVLVLRARSPEIGESLEHLLDLARRDA